MPAKLTIALIYIETVPDDDPDLSWLTQDYNDPSITPEEATRYRAEDAARLDAYNRGDWHMVGVRLAADVRLSHPGRVDEIITLRTPGIWGIESDSDEDYLSETVWGEFDMLKDDLIAFGFTSANVQDALGGDPEDVKTFTSLVIEG